MITNKDNAKDRLIIALDFHTIENARKLIDVLGEEASFYKVGLELFLNSKGEIIEYLTKKRKKIFLDLKFHDIPNTTAMASLFAAKQNVFMFNVHISGGKKMIEYVVNEVKKINSANIIIGVTVLTSLSENDVREIFQSKLSLSNLVANWANIGKKAGLDGVVCSPQEAKMIKEICGDDFKTVCPGVRPLWASVNDQERVMTPKEAILNGCDYLVMGRPIIKNDDPVNACKLIIKEIEDGLISASRL